MCLFIYLRRRPHRNVSGNNTFSGWFWNISGFMSYKRQPGREIKSIPACVLNSDSFLGLLIAFHPLFFHHVAWKLSLRWLYWFTSPSEAISSARNHNHRWMTDACWTKTFVIYFAPVLWSVHYYFSVTMATAKLLVITCVSNGIPAFCVSPPTPLVLPKVWFSLISWKCSTKRHRHPFPAAPEIVLVLLFSTFI